ncbi:hypothetical protein [Halorussus salinus]|uniref:hypothetical protein n=1 Tax=Halorussus salinus TaxID=1364935 RepID=UPI001091D447|nr:hypothetical protein [Halorussus salinus]
MDEETAGWVEANSAFAVVAVFLLVGVAVISGYNFVTGRYQNRLLQGIQLLVAAVLTLHILSELGNVHE